jgi:hypothetical protein
VDSPRPPAKAKCIRHHPELADMEDAVRSIKADPMMSIVSRRNADGQLRKPVVFHLTAILERPVMRMTMTREQSKMKQLAYERKRRARLKEIGVSRLLPQKCGEPQDLVRGGRRVVGAVQT